MFHNCLLRWLKQSKLEDNITAFGISKIAAAITAAITNLYNFILSHYPTSIKICQITLIKLYHSLRKMSISFYDILSDDRRSDANRRMSASGMTVHATAKPPPIQTILSPEWTGLRAVLTAAWWWSKSGATEVSALIIVKRQVRCLSLSSAIPTTRCSMH